jgi:hypothetical protein
VPFCEDGVQAPVYVTAVAASFHLEDKTVSCLVYKDASCDGPFLPSCGESEACEMTRVVRSELTAHCLMRATLLIHCSQHSFNFACIVMKYNLG